MRQPTCSLSRRFALGEVLEKLGELRLADTDYSGALATYEEMLAIDRELLAIDDNSTEVRWNLSLTLDQIGDVKFALGDMRGA